MIVGYKICEVSDCNSQHQTYIYPKYFSMCVIYFPLHTATHTIVTCSLLLVSSNKARMSWLYSTSFMIVNEISGWHETSNCSSCSPKWLPNISYIQHMYNSIRQEKAMNIHRRSWIWSKPRLSEFSVLYKLRYTSDIYKMPWIYFTWDMIGTRWRLNRTGEVVTNNNFNSKKPFIVNQRLQNTIMWTNNT